MKKKNIAKKAVLPALLAVLCSTAALTSVSYAWFTLGREASVNNIDVNVQAADGLQVSVDAATWGSVIDAEDLRTAKDADGNLANQMLMDDPSTDGLNEAKELLPTSTVGKVTNGAQEMFLGTVKDGVTWAKADEANFVKFDLYFKVDNKKQLQLNANSFVVDGTNKKNTHLATRVSFVDLGCAVEPVDALELTGEATGQAVIWEPNADLHTVEAKRLDKTLTDVVKAYKGVSGLTGEEDANGYKQIVESEIASGKLIATPFGTDGKITSTQNLLELEAGINKVRVYIWLEGQDVDCNNDISGNNFKAGINFIVPQSNLA